jgi:chromosome segregation ATPase
LALDQDFTKLADLEARVKGLIAHSQDLKRRNAQLMDRLREADARLAQQTLAIRQWEQEREWLRTHLKTVLAELEAIEFNEPTVRG